MPGLAASAAGVAAGEPRLGCRHHHRHAEHRSWSALHHGLPHGLRRALPAAADALLKPPARCRHHCPARHCYGGGAHRSRCPGEHSAANPYRKARAPDRVVRTAACPLPSRPAASARFSQFLTLRFSPSALADPIRCHNDPVPPPRLPSVRDACDACRFNRASTRRATWA